MVQRSRSSYRGLIFKAHLQFTNELRDGWKNGCKPKIDHNTDMTLYSINVLLVPKTTWFSNLLHGVLKNNPSIAWRTDPDQAKHRAAAFTTT